MFIMVDIEADGPIPGEYSMIEIGAVVVEPSLSKIFSGKIRPISDKWIPQALAISGYTRQQTLEFDDPQEIMSTFEIWLRKNTDNPMFIADNAGFDWMFIAWYFHRFLNRNPFGFSCTSLTSLYKGCVRDIRKSFKHLRDTPHSHVGLDDAIGNAEALIKINKQFNLRMKLE